MGSLPVILLVIVALIFIKKKLSPARIRHDNLTLITGTNGSGKTLYAVKLSLKLYHKMYRQFALGKLWCLIRHKPLPERPLLITSIPVYLGRDNWSVVLTPRMLENLSGIPHKSVVLIDEINSWVSQFNYDIKKDPKLRRQNEFFRLYRHITKGGYIVSTAQHSEDVGWIFRRKAGKVINLNGFRKYTVFGKGFGCTSAREILHAENIQTMVVVDKKSSGITADNAERKLWFCLFRKYYDTYCYSEFRAPLPIGWSQFNGYKIMPKDSKDDKE
jgi:hypothetical protein